MPTPPSSSSSSSSSSSTIRSKLPSSSPSSARLRRIAPSPVKIPKLSPSPSSVHGTRTTTSSRKLNNAHSALSNLSNSPSPKSTPSSSSSSKWRNREYEFEPLELVILSSPDTQVRTLFQVLQTPRNITSLQSGGGKRRSRAGKRKSIEEEKEVYKLPLIFDSNGEFGKLAYEAQLKEFGGVDVPSSCFSDDENQSHDLDERVDSPSGTSFMNCSPNNHNDKSSRSRSKRRSGLTLMTPSKYLTKIDFLPSPILINFRQDIFNEKGREEIRLGEKPKESTPRCSGIKLQQDQQQIHSSRPGRVDREDSSESFNTFGHGNVQSQLSKEGETETDLDNWSLTLSAYESEKSKESKGSTTTNYFRKDSFFANTTFDSSNCSSLDLTLNTPSTLDVEFVNKSILGDSTFIPPSSPSSELLVHPDSAKGEFISVISESCDSPYSDSIITPQPLLTSKAWTSSGKSGSSLNADNGDVEDTPTAKNLKAGSGIRPRSRIVSSAKKLPSLPIDQPETGISEKATGEEENGKTEEANQVEKDLRAVDGSMTIQLCVDQEGCRESRSTLKFIRSIKPCVFREREEKALQQAAIWCESPTRPESFQQSGCWEFGMEPKERDKWEFHHAALEGLPVLRRLTINNDDKLDYLSRGATLQIKEPGVYSVCGQEDRGKSEWKFEYLVQNKVSLTSGEQIANERIVVPLAFYVSPNFFNPDRALKTSLLNLFKKTLATNTMSEKIRPPHIGKPPSRPTVTSEQKTTNPEVEIQQNATNNGRKRAQTQTQGQGQAQLGLGHVETPLSKSTPYHTHSRSVSKTLGAFAKAVVGMTTTTTTPTHQLHHNTATSSSKPSTPITNNSMNINGNATGSGNRPGSSSNTGGIHKFGSKAPSFGRSGIGSRSKTPTSTEFPSSEIGNTSGEVSMGDDKKKGRKRATSLFSRSRPFTPPVNITELHPVPTLTNNPNRLSTTVSSTISSTNTGIKSATLPNTIGNGILNINSTSTLGLPLNNNHTSISLPLQQNTNLATINPGPSLTSSTYRYNRLSQQHPFLHPHQSSSHSPSPSYGSGTGMIYNASPVPSFSSIGSDSLSTSSATSNHPVITTPLLSRSSSITSRSKPIMLSQDQNKRDVDRPSTNSGSMLGLTGLTPGSRRGIRKRPSTAEPRLGMR